MRESFLDNHNFESTHSNVGSAILKLKNDTQNTRYFKDSLINLLALNNDKHKNSNIQNFQLGVIDALMEFPIIVELYINNSAFRDLFWKELKNISFQNFQQAGKEIFEGLINGTPYDAGKNSVRVILLMTGIVGVLRQFGISVAIDGAKISLKKVTMGLAMTAGHGIGYAGEKRGEDAVRQKLRYY